MSKLFIITAQFLQVQQFSSTCSHQITKYVYLPTSTRVRFFSMMWPGFATCAYLYYSLNITKNLLSIFLYQDVILYLIVYILLLFFYFHMKGCCDYSLAEILQNRRKFLNLNFFIPVLNVYAEEAKMWSSML